MYVQLLISPTDTCVYGYDGMYAPPALRVHGPTSQHSLMIPNQLHAHPPQ